MLDRIIGVNRSGVSFDDISTMDEVSQRTTFEFSQKAIDGGF